MSSSVREGAEVNPPALTAGEIIGGLVDVLDDLIYEGRITFASVDQDQTGSTRRFEVALEHARHFLGSGVGPEVPDALRELIAAGDGMRDWIEKRREFQRQPQVYLLVDKWREIAFKFRRRSQ